MDSYLDTVCRYFYQWFDADSMSRDARARRRSAFLVRCDNTEWHLFTRVTERQSLLPVRINGTLGFVLRNSRRRLGIAVSFLAVVLLGCCYVGSASLDRILVHSTRIYQFLRQKHKNSDGLAGLYHYGIRVDLDCLLGDRVSSRTARLADALSPCNTTAEHRILCVRYLCGRLGC